jgi:hypothetical protein
MIELKASLVIQAIVTLFSTLFLLYSFQRLFPRTRYEIRDSLLHAPEDWRWYEKLFGTSFNYVWNKIFKYPTFFSLIKREVISSIVSLLAGKPLMQAAMYLWSDDRHFDFNIARFSPTTLLSRLNPTYSESTAVEKYQGGESYADDKLVMTSLRNDLKSVGITAGKGDLLVLIETAFSKGKPIDDKKMTVRVKRIQNDIVQN